MLPSLLVVLLIKLTNQFLEDISHPQVGQRRQLATVRVSPFIVGEVDPGRRELFQYLQQHILIRHVDDLGAELELIDDLLDVVAEAVQIRLEVGLQNLAIVGGGIHQHLQGPGGGIVEDIPGSLFQSFRVQVGESGIIPLKLELLHDGFLARLQQAVESSQHEHGKNDITIFAAHIDVAQAVVGDGPDERDDFIMSGMIQRKCLRKITWKDYLLLLLSHRKPAHGRKSVTPVVVFGLLIVM